MIQSHMKTIGQRIRTARLQSGQTQEGLAKAIGKSKQLIRFRGQRVSIV